MTRPPIDPAMLAAFADGELGPEEAARVVMHLADHPQDQAYVDELMAANAALQQAFAAPAAEPVPDRFRDLILGAPAAEVIPFRRRVLTSARTGWLAAGLAAAAAVAGVAVLAPQGGPTAGVFLAAGPVAPDSDLGAILAAAPSGESRAVGTDRALTVLASLPAGQGFCREVEMLDRAAATVSVALACTEGAGWSVAVVVTEALPAGAAQGIVPASGAVSVDLGPWLDRVGAGLVLDPSQEARLIADGWR
jgi:hypothetical protein